MQQQQQFQGFYSREALKAPEMNVSEVGNLGNSPSMSSFSSPIPTSKFSHHFGNGSVASLDRPLPPVPTGIRIQILQAFVQTEERSVNGSSVSSFRVDGGEGEEEVDDVDEYDYQGGSLVGESGASINTFGEGDGMEKAESARGWL